MRFRRKVNSRECNICRNMAFGGTSSLTEIYTSMRPRLRENVLVCSFTGIMARFA